MKQLTYMQLKYCNEKCKECNKLHSIYYNCQSKMWSDEE